jgi:hypothetical protein
VRLGYIKQPGVNVYKKTPSLQTEKFFNRNSVFRCPEGVDEGDQWFDPSFPGGDYPTDANNNGYTILNDSNCAQDGFGIPSWYMLNSRVCNGVGAMAWPGGARRRRSSGSTPPHAGRPVGAEGQALHPHVGCVKRSAELLMLVEAPNPNFYDQR